MNKVPLEIIIPVFNEGENVVRLMEFLNQILKQNLEYFFVTI